MHLETAELHTKLPLEPTDVQRMHASDISILANSRSHPSKLLYYTGEATQLIFTLSYAAPEVIAAFEAGARSHIVSPAADVWALGLIAFEMLTGERTFPPFTETDDILNAISGRTSLPWEGPRRPELLRKLRVFRKHVLECLLRDPAKRPPIDAVIRGWDHLFQATSTTVTQANLRARRGV
jgi:serine/threonine protein kinase